MSWDCFPLKNAGIVIFKLRILDTLPTFFFAFYWIANFTFKSRHLLFFPSCNSTKETPVLKILGSYVLTKVVVKNQLSGYSSWSSNYKAIILNPRQHFETNLTFFCWRKYLLHIMQKNREMTWFMGTFYQCNITWVLKFSHWV